MLPHAPSGTNSASRCMGQSKGPLVSLIEVVEGAQPLVILPHDNPDPDALASAAALQYVLEERRVAKVERVLKRARKVAVGELERD